MSKRLFVLCLALSPLAAFAACSGDSSPNDAGADSGKDVTTSDVAKDSSQDSTVKDATQDTTVKDAPLDVAPDVAPDAPPDAPSEASADASADAAQDASTDASDAGADAADGGGSSWHTPTCDGVIGTNEYGPSQNQMATSSSQTWYVTWDATNLYVALDGATLTEANVVYVGFSGSGYQTAQVYDGTGGTLNFLADGAIYAKSGYQETRIASSTGWGNAATNTVMFCSSGSTREEVIPWTALGATSIPSAFRFIAYATSGTGFVYGQIPSSLPGGNVGTSASWNHDFYVSSTNDGTGTFPFDVTE